MCSLLFEMPGSNPNSPICISDEDAQDYANLYNMVVYEGPSPMSFYKVYEFSQVCCCCSRIVTEDYTFSDDHVLVNRYNFTCHGCGHRYYIQLRNYHDQFHMVKVCHGITQCMFVPLDLFHEVFY